MSTLNAEGPSAIVPGEKHLVTRHDLVFDPRMDKLSFKDGKYKVVYEGIEDVVKNERRTIHKSTRYGRDPEEFSEVLEVPFPVVMEDFNRKGATYSFVAKSTNRHLFRSNLIVSYFLITVVNERKWLVTIRINMPGEFTQDSLRPALTDSSHSLNLFMRENIYTETFDENNEVHFRHDEHEYCQRFLEFWRVLNGEETIEAVVTSEQVVTGTAKRGPAARGRATTPVVRTEVLHFHTNQFTNNVSRRCFQELQTGGEEQVYQFHATGKSDEGLYAPNTIVNYQFKVKNVRFFPGSPPECDVTVHKSLANWGDRSKGVKRQRREIYRAVVLADDDEEDCEIRA